MSVGEMSQGTLGSRNALRVFSGDDAQGRGGAISTAASRRSCTSSACTTSASSLEGASQLSCAAVSPNVMRWRYGRSLSMTLGETAAQLSWLAPSKLDAEVVHALLVQLRRDAAVLMAPPRPWASSPEKTRKAFLDPSVPCDISPTDIDHLVSELNHRINRGRTMA